MKKNDLDEKIFNALLKVAAEEALKQDMEDTMLCEEANELYKPSSELDKRISKMIRRFSRRSELWRNSVVKVAAYVVLVITVSCTALLSVEATRNFIFNAIIEWREEYFSIEHASVEKGDAGAAVYRPSYLPAGFAEVTSGINGGIVDLVYQNEEGGIIRITYSPTQNTKKLADNEDRAYSEVLINERKGYLQETVAPDEYNILIWEYDGILFSLVSDINSAEMILVAESI